MDGDSMGWQVFQALRRLGADRAAMTLSGLCLVHCLAGIVLFSTFTVLGDVLVSPLVHEIGLGIAIVLAAWALGRGYLRHHRLFPAAMGCARSEEHTSELQSLMRISYAVFCWKKKKNQNVVRLVFITQLETKNLVIQQFTCHHSSYLFR